MSRVAFVPTTFAGSRCISNLRTKLHLSSRRPRFHHYRRVISCAADSNSLSSPQSNSSPDNSSNESSTSNSPPDANLEFSNGKGGGNGSGQNDGNGDDSDGHSEDGDPSISAALGQNASSKGKSINVRFVKTTASFAKHIASDLYAMVSSWMGGLLKVVPAPVIVALISLVSTASGARYKARRDKEVAIIKEQAAAKKHKLEIERQLRKTYTELAAPVLKSAAKLAERLHMLVAGDFDMIERPGTAPIVSPMYSAYLLGRYLGMVEIIKRESAVLDFGFPAADRVLMNILGRIQGVLSANNKVLQEMQMREGMFQPDKGLRTVKSGPLRITPRAQQAIGNLMLRKVWVDKSEYIESVDEEELKRGPQSVISFVEFGRLMRTERLFCKWMTPVIESFVELEEAVKRTPIEKRRNDEVGSRVFFVQNGLMDLVEFFDPLPQAKSVPLYSRQRLQLGRQKYGEQQQAPLSIQLLYKELAKIRDHRVIQGNQIDRLKLPKSAVEVHVKAAQNDSDSMLELTKNGDCPYSQRVVLVLEELGIPYHTVMHSARAKPSWYYLLHPENMTPIIYHNGSLVEDSSHIVTYLQSDSIGSEKQLASTGGLGLNVGTKALTKFHGDFLRWVEHGDKRNRVKLDEEVRALNKLIKIAQEKNAGAPFLGGERFSSEDTAVLPMLNNVVVAGKEIMKWDLPKDCEALQTYLTQARQVESFRKAAASKQAIVAGYAHLRVNGEAQKLYFCDMLE